MPRKIRDFALAVTGLAILLGVLALVDERVPGRVAALAGDVSSGRWRQPGTLTGNLLLDVAASPTLDNVFLLALLGAGIVLVILMVRT